MFFSFFWSTVRVRERLRERFRDELKKGTRKRGMCVVERTLTNKLHGGRGLLEHCYPSQGFCLGGWEYQRGSLCYQTTWAFCGFNGKSISRKINFQQNQLSSRYCQEFGRSIRFRKAAHLFHISKIVLLCDDHSPACFVFLFERRFKAFLVPR